MEAKSNFKRQLQEAMHEIDQLKFSNLAIPAY